MEMIKVIKIIIIIKKKHIRGDKRGKSELWAGKASKEFI